MRPTPPYSTVIPPTQIQSWPLMLRVASYMSQILDRVAGPAVWS
jgi:hypothetical protein